MTSPKRLFRSRSDRIIAGVAGGLGGYLGVDPTVVRALFVLLALTGGIGILLYLTLAIVVPEEPQPAGLSPSTLPPPASTPQPFQPPTLRRNTFAILVMAVGVTMLFTETFFRSRLELLWPVVVIGIGVYLIARRP
ncbi:MAG: PspC domain-containing protein [Candidatus Kerfeldbacteria bacterium]|nr:PspC domain-containing protein [Candidatus Kerfeldbacteria bacterium]